MTSTRIVIIGGVAGGAGAAAKARRENEHAEITLFERGPYVSFANCGLPYYIGGDIADRKSLILQTPESFWKRFRVRVHVGHEVRRIDRAGKFVEGLRLSDGAPFRADYDTLVLAPGAGAVVPPVPGLPAPNVFTVKTVPDSDAIKEFIETKSPRRAVVVGAGFIGLESAEALVRRGLEVTVVELENQVLPPFDPDVASFVAAHLRDAGVRLALGDGLKAFHGSPVTEIELTSGRRIPLDLAVLSIGVRPELTLAREAGLTIGDAGGIAVDDRQRTSDPNIYAAGDAVEVRHLVTGQFTRLPLAGPANKQGRVAGANAAGGSLTFPGAVGTAIVECLGVTAAKTGLSEKEARRLGYDIRATATHSLSHAGYYPGGEMLHLKLVSEKSTGRLLGGQIVGEHGVDKRIDVLAAALATRMSVNDLENLDLAYAPQFSSAKDPVVMAGFVAANDWRGDDAVLSVAELRERLGRGEALELLDVRTAKEFERDHMDGARNIPLDELRERLEELNRDRPTVVTCQIGLRAHIAARILRQSGFAHVWNLTGGMTSYAGATVKPTPPSRETWGPDVTVIDLKQALERGAVLAVDVREPDEFRWEHVAGSRNLPLSRFDAERGDLPKDRPLFVLCQTGYRSARAVDDLRRAGWGRAHRVVGGLDAWRREGFPTNKTSRGPIPLMRQVQIAAGTLVVLGSLIPHARPLAVFVGAGLVFAGVSGWCGLARLLAFLPWNRRTGGSRCG
jgi:NADPH-dependent 2,4-dienoyl-CoA reductase/sulfur reductase-like enzyme/rhodanese-related sulfurtransferase